VFDKGAQAVPQIPMGGLPSAGYSDPLDRFANSIPTLPTSVAFPSDRPAPAPSPDNDAHVDPKKVRRVSSPFFPANGGAAKKGEISTPGNLQPTLGDWPPATQPLPEYPSPPMAYDLADPSRGSSDNIDDWLNRWIKSLVRR
jgi:hypothetical protein